MKALLLICALILAAACMAQTSPAGKADSSAAKPGQLSAETVPNISPDTNTCYTMRSYIFAVRDGVHQLVGEKTCTSSQKFNFAYIPARPPRVQPAPADLRQRKDEPPPR